MRFGIFILLGVFMIGFVSAVIPDDCDSSIVAYWKFDGDTTDEINSPAQDGSGSSSWDIFKVEQAIRLGGIEKISVQSNSNLFLVNSFTIEFWVKSNPSPVNRFLLNKGDYKIEYTSGDDINATVNGVSVFSQAPADIPYHVALTWDGADLILYFDGVSKSTAPLVGPIPSSGVPLEFGEDYSGLLDEMAFYNVALNSTEINRHYTLSNSGFDYCYSVGEGGSTARSDFTIPGCFLNDGSSLSAGTCSADGRLYCSDAGSTLYDTLNNASGCTRGDETQGPPAPNPCCPAEYICNGTASSMYCDQRLVDCSTFTDEDSCGEAECYWIILGGNGTCVGRTSDYSCSIYKQQEDCVEDRWNLGGEGLGTESCGGYFVDNLASGGDGAGYIIVQDSCVCSWADVGNGEECLLMSETSPDIWGVGGKDSFNCYKSFETGTCDDGFQQINWTASVKNLDGEFITNQTFLDRIRDLTKCTNGTHNRACGEPIVRLPGFSMFAFFLSIGILSLFYVLRKRI